MAEPSGAETAHSDEHHSHAVPLRTLAGVFAALIVLTVITVAVAYVDLGELNLFVALSIAVVKGALVALYFMHLRWDSPFNGAVLIVALAFVALFIGLSAQDRGEYKDQIRQYQYDHPERVQPAGSSKKQGGSGEGAS